MPVIAAVDRSERSESVLEEARRLADNAGVGLHVVHVGDAELPSSMDGYDAERANTISERKAVGVAREIARAVLGDDDYEAVGFQGDPASKLLEYTQEQDADYVVVSARKRSPFGQAVFGSVTQSLLLEADCPVVATPHTSE